MKTAASKAWETRRRNAGASPSGKCVRCGGKSRHVVCNGCVFWSSAATGLGPAPRRVETEEEYERRAAFGPGVEVVNLITGKRYRT